MEDNREKERSFRVEHLTPNYDSEIFNGDDDDEEDDTVEEDEAEIESKHESLFAKIDAIKAGRGSEDVSQTTGTRWRPNTSSGVNTSSLWGDSYTGRNYSSGSSAEIYSPFGSNRQNTGGYQPYQPSSSFNRSFNENKLPRDKKFLICDFFDCLVETYQSNGRPGLVPRGIYDVKPRFEVWDRIGQLGLEKVFPVVPRNIILSGSGEDSWIKLLDYYATALCEYLKLDYSFCQVVSMSKITTKFETVKHVIKSTKLNKDEIFFIGTESGFVGQGSRDIEIADELDLSYIDLGQLVTQY